MKIALIADAFPPLRTSCAILWRDLSLELVKLGHHPTVITPSDELCTSWIIDELDGVEIVRLKSPKTKDINYLRRTLNEFLMPFWMLRHLRKSPLRDRCWDGIVWYSPTIFLGPLASVLKKSSNVPSYLIIRDIFPDWALDLGLIGRGLPYQFFKRVAEYQYAVADVIGVQTKSNIDLLPFALHRKVEVLHNWLADAPDKGCAPDVLEKIAYFKGRTIFVYAGNMGVAQNVDIFIDLAEKLQARPDIGFLFVGRGSELHRLRQSAQSRHLLHVVFHDEIEPSDVPGLLSYCHVGLVALATRHKTHNIPGKFLTYMQAGLPVLASINPGNDLEGLIQSEGVGRVCTDGLVDTLYDIALALLQDRKDDSGFSERCRTVSKKQFSPTVAAKQVISALSSTCIKE